MPEIAGQQHGTGWGQNTVIWHVASDPYPFVRVQAVPPSVGVARLKTANYPNLQSVTKARTIFHPTLNFFSLLKNAHRVALAKDSQLIYNGKIE